MREGIYRIDYVGETGIVGFGLLVFDSGKVWGIDVADALYNGDYVYNKKTGQIDTRIEAAFLPNTELVSGHTVGPEGFSATFKPSLPTDLDKPVTFSVTLLEQVVTVRITKVRDAPDSY